tara:strand:- start:1 stop:294 length:294 start_codon:yes stop_codon:yes gene_type:complete
MGFSVKSKRKKVSDGQLWVDVHKPKTVDTVAVHKKKVMALRDALTGGGEYSSSLKMLLLTGPPGAGKSTLLKLLATEQKMEVLNWRLVSVLCHLTRE